MIDASFEQLPVHKAVLRQSAPAILSQLIVLLYNWADAYFVAQLNDPAQLAAVSIVTPVFLMVTAVANLTGVGGCAAFSACLGKKDETGAQHISAIAFWTGLLTALLFSGLYLLTSDYVLPLTGAGEATLAPAKSYARYVVAIGAVPVITNQILANLFRAEGMAKKAAIGISLGGLLNIVLDPLFISPQFGHMGVAGAGLATALSNFCSVVFFFCVLWRNRRQRILSIAPRHLRRAKEYIGRILSRGLPSCLQYMLTVVAVGALAHFLSTYGTQPMAALAIVKELDYLPLYFSIGLSQGILPLIAYCHGAGNSVRRDSLYRFGTAVSVGFALLCFVVYESWAPELATFFIDNAETDRYIASFLRCMVVAMPFMAYCYPTIIYFQATGHIKEAMVCTILRKGVVDVPLLFVYSALWGMYGCVCVQPTVDFIAMVTALWFWHRIRRAEESLKVGSIN